MEIIELPVREELKQLFGVLHGGIIATVLDMAMAAAASTVLPDDQYTTTIDMHTSYLRPMFGETLKGEATVLKKGKRVTVVTGQVTDEQGTIIATSTGHFMNLKK